MAEGRNLVFKFFNVIRANGGITNTLMGYTRGIEPRYGHLVGEDEFGNKYYKNDKYFVGRNRWVIYNKKTEDAAFGYWHLDASQIPPAWHRWIHHMTDDPPSELPIPREKFSLPHQPNYSGINRSYTPFSTTPTKIHAWKPPQDNQTNN